MKINKTYLYISISSLALMVVLIIQVNWIFQTAQIKEQLFNEKANIVLSRTAADLSKDEQACKNIEAGMSANERAKIDSLFNHYMKFYNFYIDYSFVVAKPTQYAYNYGSGFGNEYNKRLDEVVSKNGLELKLIFPEKNKFIVAEMGPMFITSVMLIIIVLIMFWRTVLSLMKEKSISEHTTEFLNNMTHEFKTPLTNIALAGKMIVRDPGLNQESKIKHYSEIILEENEKLRLQVEQVLSMTALERGEIPLHKTKLSFHEIIDDALKCMQMQIENKHANVTLNLNAEYPELIGDKTHLTNALCNLIDNALKYSPEMPEILIQTNNTDQNIMIAVIDKGIGIEKDFHSKVFDKYFRIPTGDVHNVKGFGLGLSYVKKIVELHDGQIELKSNNDNGTTLLISLPHA